MLSDGAVARVRDAVEARVEAARRGLDEALAARERAEREASDAASARPGADEPLTPDQRTRLEFARRGAASAHARLEQAEMARSLIGPGALEALGRALEAARSSRERRFSEESSSADRLCASIGELQSAMASAAALKAAGGLGQADRGKVIAAQKAWEESNQACETAAAARRDADSRLRELAAMLEEASAAARGEGT